MLNLLEAPRFYFVSRVLFEVGAVEIKTLAPRHALSRLGNQLLVSRNLLIWLLAHRRARPRRERLRQSLPASVLQLPSAHEA